MLVKTNHNTPIIPNVFNELLKDMNLLNFSDTNSNIPAVNVNETVDDFVVSVAVPGMDKKDFIIDLEKDILTISSEKNSEKEVEQNNYTHKEYSYQSFKRSFNLPKNTVDNEKVTAKYINGELIINIPKREEAKPKPARLIEIK